VFFLIEYDRGLGRLISFRAFQDPERSLAEETRLQLEVTLALARTEREVVLLEAETEEALRRTHRRYFEALAELAATPDGFNKR
jgi:hypothetical protein